MSEYELAYMFLETARFISELFIAAGSVMTGFVVIGLFFGQMLNRAMTTIFVALYTILLAGTLFQISRVYSTFVSIALEIKARHAETGAYEWHSVIATPVPLLQSGPVFVVVMLVTAYIGTLIFFFQTKKLDPKEFR